MNDPEYSITERAIGAAIGNIIYNEVKEDFREAEINVRIRRHVKRAYSVKQAIQGEDK